jgi:predicted GNAT superfamily acetyltransferase
MAVTKVFTYQGARAQLAIWDECNATLSNVFSVNRGRGHANRLMENVCKYAEKHELTLLLEVQQFGYADRDSPDNSGLKTWYRKFGFESLEGNRMIRSREKHVS